MIKYMLDTNTVSDFIKKQPAVTTKLLAVPMRSLCISSITEAELLYGVGKRPAANKLHKIVNEFLQRVDVLAWDRQAAERYAIAKVKVETKGQTLSPFDLLIASHALSTGCTLVSNDKAFRFIPGLSLENWSHTRF
jgi:tRNA(fMet)-specific endonuclease VapC